MEKIMKHNFTFIPAVRLAALIALALGVAACVGPGPVYQGAVCGMQVTFHPDDLKPCARGATACTLQQGASAYQVYYSTLDEGVMDHEKEHVCGMRHREPWVYVAGKTCTVVTEGGNTHWKKGDVMCRVDAGPPVKITDARVLSNITLSAR
jgi:hypothetical protein